jgi:hypothetical protein
MLSALLARIFARCSPLHDSIVRMKSIAAVMTMNIDLPRLIS